VRPGKVFRCFKNSNDDFAAAVAVHIRNRQPPWLPTPVNALPDYSPTASNAQRGIAFVVKFDMLYDAVTVEVRVDGDGSRVRVDRNA